LSTSEATSRAEVQRTSGRPVIRAFFDEQTNPVSSPVADPAIETAAIIDPSFVYDYAAGTVDTHFLGTIQKAADEAA
jgi:hypothetical protein